MNKKRQKAIAQIGTQKYTENLIKELAINLDETYKLMRWEHIEHEHILDNCIVTINIEKS